MSLLTWLYGDTENAKRAADADAKLRELNDQAAKKYGASWGDQVAKDYEAQSSGGWVPPAEQEKQVDQAFGEGWQDGKRNVTGFISGTFKVVGDVLSSVLLGVPAWLWLIGAVALWIYLGAPGLRQLKGKFK